MLSVIIVHYDTPDITRRTLESVFRWTTGLRYEVIVVDNASPNADPSSLTRGLPEIVLVQSPSNVGFAAGNNLGLERAKGDVILLLNSDIILEEDAIGKSWRRLTSDSRIDVISPRLIYPNGTLQRTCRRLPSLGLLVLEMLRLHKLMSRERRARVLSGSYSPHDTECEVESVWAAFFMFKRRALRAFPNSRLPDSFFMYGEDTEWCLLLKRAGARILYYPQATAVHLVSASSAFSDSSREKARIIEQNRDALLRRYHGAFYAASYRALARLARWLA